MRNIYAYSDIEPVRDFCKLMMLVPWDKAIDAIINIANDGKK